MKLKSLIEQYQETDSIRISESIERQIVSLVNEHVKKQSKIYQKYDIDDRDTDFYGYDPERGSWTFKSCLPDEVYLEYTVCYGSCGCEGFSKFFKYNEVDKL